jgi:hypothetical protein
MKSNRSSNEATGLVVTLGLLYFVFKPRSIDTMTTRPIGISDHFNMNELTRTSYNTPQSDHDQYAPSTEVINAARKLATLILEPLRAKLGGPISINSWYRSESTLEKMIAAGEDASPHSTHRTGGTADIIFRLDGERRNDLIMRALLAYHLPFDRVIIEHGTLNRPQYIHVEFNPSLPAEDQRRQVLRIAGGNTSHIDLAQAEAYYL